MNKKRIAQYCCAALVLAGVGLNIQNAIADYGIAENSLSLVAVGGSNSGSNSNSNSNSNFLDDPDIIYRWQLKTFIVVSPTGGLVFLKCCTRVNDDTKYCRISRQSDNCPSPYKNL